MKIRNLDHLRYFIDALRLGGVAASAERNRVAPSTVSQAVRQLEAHLGVELLEHGRNAFVPTAAARALAEGGEELLARVRTLEEETLRAGGAFGRDVLRLGVSRSLATRFLPDALPLMGRLLPGVRVALSVGKSADLLVALERGELELAIVLETGAAPRREALSLRKGSFVLAGMPVAPRMVGGRGRERTDGLDGPFLITEPRPEVDAFKAWYRTTRQREPSILLEADSWEILDAYARRAAGAALLPDYFLDASSPLVRVEGSPPRFGRYVVRLCGVKGSPWLRAVRGAFTRS